MPRRHLEFALLLYLVVAGCGLNGSDNDPRLFMDTYEEGYDGFAFLHVSWWYPPGGATAYVLEQFDSSGNHADIKVGALGQKVTAQLDIEASQVRIEVQLPFLLAALANKIQPYLQKSGTDMLRLPPKK